MKKGFTDIVLVLDESGSMDIVKDETVHAFTKYFEEQWAQPGEVKIGVVRFASTVAEYTEVVKGGDLFYNPSGGTALYDAIGYTIEYKGKVYASMTEDERPENVIIVIQTDGEENSSKKFFGDKIKSMIEHQQSKYNWAFVFLGANQDAVLAGAGMGIAMASSISYSNNDAGIKGVTEALSGYTKTVRSAGAAAAAFTVDDRNKANGQ